MGTGLVVERLPEHRLRELEGRRDVPRPGGFAVTRLGRIHVP